MRYRVDTQSLRMAEGNLLQVSSSLDTICVNIRNVQRNLSVRVRDNGDINHEFHFISQELSNLEKLIFKASRFLRESADSYEQVESRNLIDIIYSATGLILHQKSQKIATLGLTFSLIMYQSSVLALV